VYHYLVRDREHGEMAIKELVRIAQASNEIRAKADAKRAQEQAENRGKYTVGTILCNSWGYEQTNIDYYQVTKCSKSGATVEVRPIASKHIANTGFMSDTVGPNPGAFTGEAFKKRVTAYGVQFAHGWTSICKADDTHNATHYA